MKNVTLKNISPLGDIQIPTLGHEVPAGGTFMVSADVAGRPPSTYQDDDGNDVVDLGDGLLAQVGNYELASSAGPTVADLREDLKARGLDTKGTKDELIARLAADQGNTETKD